jgi:hypothetical protein
MAAEPVVLVLDESDAATVRWALLNGARTLGVSGANRDVRYRVEGLVVQLDEAPTLAELVGCAAATDVNTAEERWLSVARVAEALGVSTAYVRRCAERFGGRKVGREWMFPAGAIEAEAARRGANHETSL